MLLKHSLTFTVVVGTVVALAACQASFKAGASSASNANSATGGTTAGSESVTAVAGEASVAQADPARNTNPASTTATKLSGGRIVPQGTLQWDSGKPILLSSTDNEAILNDLKLFLDQNPKVTQMRIEGHTDNVGKAADNLELSGQRALAVKKTLMDKGITKERLVAVGFGDQKPIGDNATDAGRAKNQRIEFRVATWNGKNYLNQDPLGGGKLFE
jgi:OOP family OmpA-OmpF porin